MKLNSCAELPTSTRVSDVSLCWRSLDERDFDLILLRHAFSQSSPTSSCEAELLVRTLEVIEDLSARKGSVKFII